MPYCRWLLRGLVWFLLGFFRSLFCVLCSLHGEFVFVFYESLLLCTQNTDYSPLCFFHMFCFGERERERAGLVAVGRWLVGGWLWYSSMVWYGSGLSAVLCMALRVFLLTWMSDVCDGVVRL